jgi:NAD(P) transhydrogenase subunit alpha
MKIAILKETATAETRVAATPETVKKLQALGAEVVVESGAGANVTISDAAYQGAGAAIGPATDADIVLCVRAPEAAMLKTFKKGAAVIGLFNPHQNRAAIDAAAAQGLSAFSLELVPRITRAQSMDVLSSQANLAGYRAVIEAAHAFGRAFPLMMTAAGTVPPARIFIMGAGVAGLQAIATARRLGAQVSATDVRPAAREQVESLGATFVMVESEETKAAETAGGYAREMSDDYKRQQADLIAETIKKQDIVITTALIPGRAAPQLVTAEMVASMKPGSVIVDLAVEAGGNCALSKAGETVIAHDVTIVGHLNMPGRIGVDASALYARNVVSFLTPLIDRDAKAFAPKPEDEIVAATCLTRDGAVVHPHFKA